MHLVQVCGESIWVAPATEELGIDVIVFIRNDLDEFQCLLQERRSVGMVIGEKRVQAEHQIGYEDLADTRELSATC